MVRAVVVELYLDVGLFELSCPPQLPLHVLDAESSRYPHRLIVGLDGPGLGELLSVRGFRIEILGGEQHWQVILLHHICRIGEEEVGVGLQMNDAFVDEELPVSLHEVCRCEALAGILHLRVGEREPYLLHLVLGKEPLDDLDVGAEESKNRLLISNLFIFLYQSFCLRIT